MVSFVYTQICALTVYRQNQILQSRLVHLDAHTFTHAPDHAYAGTGSGRKICITDSIITSHSKVQTDAANAMQSKIVQKALLKIDWNDALLDALALDTLCSDDHF